MSEAFEQAASSVVVLALHQQRPDQDVAVATSLIGVIERYRARVEVDAEVPELPGVRYYQPVSALPTGQYDYATLYAADDLENVVEVAAHHGATAHEWLFCPVPGEDEDRDALRILLGRDGDAPPFMAIVRVKVGDHLIAGWGGCFLESVRRSVRARLGDWPTVSAAVLECWSWPELLVLLQADEPESLVEASHALEHLSVDDVAAQHPGAWFPEAPRSVRGSILRAWAAGRDSTLPAADIEAILRVCHVSVHVKTQLCLRQDALAGADDPLARVLAEAYMADGGRDLAGLDPDTFCATLEATRPAPDATACHGRIRLLPRPGHAQEVRHLAGRVQSALGEGSALTGTPGGDGAVVELRVPDLAGAEGLHRLLAVALWFRLRQSLRDHLHDVSSSLHFAQTAPARPPARLETRLAEAVAAAQRGYRLLSAESRPEQRDFQRQRLRARGIGNVESTALLGWMATVEAALSRPEMTGALVDLAGVKRLVANDAFSRERDNRRFPEMVQTVTAYGQRAFHQRIHSSPVLAGTTALLGELPSGINQLVRMVSGVATAFFSLRDPTRVLEPGAPTPTERLMVVFGSDATVGTRRVGDVMVLCLSVVQSLSPISLCLLAHELGHELAWRWTATDDGTGEDAWQQRLRATSRELFESPGAPYPTDDPSFCTTDEEASFEPVRRQTFAGRLLHFLEDIFAHAVWRRLGCGNDWGLFRFQFLLTHAMGLRTGVPSAEQHRTLDYWAQALAHLRVQQAMAEAEAEAPGPEAWLTGLERLRDALLAAADDDGVTADEVFDETVSESRAFWAVEVAPAVEALRPGADPEEALQSFTALWSPQIAAIADRVLRPDAYGASLRDVFRALADLEAPLPPLRGADADALRRAVAEGRRVPPVPADHLEGADASSAAFVRARSILAGVTDFYRARPVDRDAPWGVARDPETGAVDGGGALCADHLGGTWVRGPVRRELMRVRVAAIDALLSLSDRVSAGRLDRLFRLRRRYPRTPSARFPREKPTRTRLEIGDRGLLARIEDLCPVGARLTVAQESMKVLFDPDSGTLKHEAVELDTIRGPRPARIAWARPGGDGLEIGVRVMQGGSEPRPAAPFLELYWLRGTPSQTRASVGAS